MTFTYRHKKELIIASSIILLLSVVTSVIFLEKNHSKKTKDKKIVINNKKEIVKEKDKTKDDEEIYYQVDIKGEVNNPGIYTVKKDSRVIDVIRLAGDLTANADTKVLNLSKKVTDEMVIIVYSYYEVEHFTETKEKEKIEQENCSKQSEIINGACIGIENNNPTSLKISINTASIEDFMTLPGIGEAKAKAIINYREEKGSFQNIEELLEVDGIGENLFDQIKENITI